jgi:DNA-binding CsgD family transcriptional regulator/PAS domain-containing protein
MPGSDRELHLAGLIYEASLDPTRWKECVAALIQAFGSVGGFYSLVDLTHKRVNLTLSCPGDKCMATLYNQDLPGCDARALQVFHTADASRVRACVLPVGRQVPTKDCRPDAVQGAKPDGIVLSASDNRGQVAFLGLCRCRGMGGFHNQARDLFVRLLPHFERTQRIRRHLAHLDLSRDVTAGALDRMTTGLFVVDTKGMIRLTNRRGAEILHCNDGLIRQGNTLAATDAAENRHLRELITAAARSTAGQRGDPGAAIRVSRPSGRTPYSLVIAPAASRQAQWEANGGLALAFVNDPGHGFSPPDDILAQLFGLTPRETRLAIGLLNGKTVNDLAADFAVTPATLRTQLQAVFDKTGTNRQGDLMRLLALQVGTLELRPPAATTTARETNG